MEKVFINFRNGDGEYAALYVYKELSERYGPDNVFRSSDSILPGEDFREQLTEKPRECDALLAIIGPRWLAAADADGRPRLASPRDWVRREIATALTAGNLVIPVLLNGTAMPDARSLPSDITALTDRQYVRLETRDAHGGMSRLHVGLARIMANLAPADRDGDRPPTVIQRNSPSGGGTVNAPIFGNVNNFRRLAARTVRGATGLPADGRRTRSAPPPAP